MKFAPFVAGKQQQHATYDTVKAHIIQLIQKNYKFGNDLAKRLEKEEPQSDDEEFYKSVGLKLPDKKKKEETTEYDMIEYKEVFRERRERKRILQDNEHKSYSLIMTMCTTTMQHRIESDSDFEASIKDNPYSLLKAIKKKMFDPAKSKYSFAVFTEQLERLLSIRQEDGESLTEYVKRFKQHRDNTKELIGRSFLDQFIENTEDYRPSDNDTQKKWGPGCKSFVL